MSNRHNLSPPAVAYLRDILGGMGYNTTQQEDDEAIGELFDEFDITAAEAEAAAAGDDRADALIRHHCGLSDENLD